MLALLKLAWSSIWPLLAPLVLRLAFKTKDVLVEAIKTAMAKTQKDIPNAPWAEKLQYAVAIAIPLLEADGLKLGKDFFTNDLVGLVSALVEKQWAS